MSGNDLQSRTVAVCVLGMHRSGTSALTRVVNLHGVYLGEDLIPNSIDNPMGFWEHRAIRGVHEKLLDALGSSFDDVLSLPAGWNLGTEVKPFRSKLIEIIGSQLIPYGKLWGFKDPRVCRLLPMWREIYDTVGIDDRYILTIRNPEEIARSLAVRDGYSLNKSLLLTLMHLLEAEAGTRGKPRVVVSYKSLMEDWKAVSKKIADALNLIWPRSSEKIAPQVAEFLAADLRHHVIEDSLLSSSALAGAEAKILRWITQLHEMLTGAESDTGRIDSGLVDRIRGELEAEYPRVDAWEARHSLSRQNMPLEKWDGNLNRTRQKQAEHWLDIRGRKSSENLSLPDFLGIGAQKSGTSWLYENLRHHPNVFVSPVKEVHYFDEHFDEPLRGYASIFETGAGKIKGEVTPAYSILPPARIAYIHAVMPRVRLIFLMRNPIERAWSHAVMALVTHTGRKFDDVSPREFIRHFNSAANLGRGDYETILNNWLDVFPREQVLIDFFESIIERPVQLLREVCRHIGLTADVDWEGFPYRQKIYAGPGITVPEKYFPHLRDLYLPRMIRLRKRLGAGVDRWLDSPLGDH